MLLVAICAIAAEILMRRTRYGAQLYAIGGNPEAARLAGIDVARRCSANLLIAGLAYGITGIALTARVSGAVAGSAGLFLELDAIAAAIIGGTALAGGRGTIFGALLGALLMGSLNNGMSLMNVGRSTRTRRAAWCCCWRWRWTSSGGGGSGHRGGEADPHPNPLSLCAEERGAFPIDDRKKGNDQPDSVLRRCAGGLELGDGFVEVLLADGVVASLDAETVGQGEDVAAGDAGGRLEGVGGEFEQQAVRVAEVEGVHEAAVDAAGVGEADGGQPFGGAVEGFAGGLVGDVVDGADDLGGGVGSVARFSRTKKVMRLPSPASK